MEEKHVGILKSNVWAMGQWQDKYKESSFVYVLREVNYKLLYPLLLTKLCKAMHQEAASEIAETEV